MEKIQSAIEAPLPVPKEQDADDVFGLMVATELKCLPNSKKRKLKHEINNLIFKYQEENEENVAERLNSTHVSVPPAFSIATISSAAAQMPAMNAVWPLAGLSFNN